jgi:hypothetical protein
MFSFITTRKIRSYKDVSSFPAKRVYTPSAQPIKRRRHRAVVATTDCMFKELPNFHKRLNLLLFRGWAGSQQLLLDVAKIQ